MSGTYWYATCFLFALFLFCFLIKHFNDRTCKFQILCGGCIAIIESNLLTGKLGEYVIGIVPKTSIFIKLLNSPGMPWNFDVALLVLVYFAIGYYNKDRIHKVLYSDDRKLDILAGIVAVVLIIFCYFNYKSEETLYYFDMKPVYYHELFLTVIIPCAFGIVLARLVRWVSGINVLSWLYKGLAYLGQMTIPIMFMHVPLNTWKDALGYGQVIYLLMGVGVPVIFTLTFNRFSMMRKLFGLSVIKTYAT